MKLKVTESAQQYLSTENITERSLQQIGTYQKFRFHKEDETICSYSVGCTHGSCVFTNISFSINHIVLAIEQPHVRLADSRKTLSLRTRFLAQEANIKRIHI